MALTINRPLNEARVFAQTTSVATTPVAGAAIAPCAGVVHRVFAGSSGTTTGTITVAVAVNGGSDICSGGLTIAAGAGTLNAPAYLMAQTGPNAVTVSEGDYITFTPSGGTGASIPGAFGLVIRAFA
jgi:hypothetical protein